MNWYKYTEISKLREVIRPKGFWKSLLLGFSKDGNGIIKRYQHGIILINENGDTKEIWENYIKYSRSHGSGKQ